MSDNDRLLRYYRKYPISNAIDENSPIDADPAALAKAYPEMEFVRMPEPDKGAVWWFFKSNDDYQTFLRADRIHRRFPANI